MNIIKTFSRFLKKQKRISIILGIALIVAILLESSGIQISFPSNKSDSKPLITIGSVNALTSYDYTFTGDIVHDTAQMQAAVDALPAIGGRVEVFASGNITFNTAITRATSNVTIEGCGASTYFSLNGVNPVFIDGGNNWRYINMGVDAGGINHGAFSGWLCIDWTWGTTLYSLYTQSAIVYAKDGTITNLTSSVLIAPISGGASIVVAASDAPTIEKNQANPLYVCDGDNDQVQINAALTASAGGIVHLTLGHYSVVATANASILVTSNSTLEGEGFGTIITLANGSVGSVISNSNPMGGNTNVNVRNLFVDGNALGSGAGTPIDYAHTTTNYSQGICFRNVSYGTIRGVWAQNCREGNDVTIRGTPIFVTNSSYITIEGNFVTLGGHDNISVRFGSGDIKIINNYSWLPADECIQVASGTVAGIPANILIDGNHCWSANWTPTGSGFSTAAIKIDTNDPYCGSKISIVNNIIHDCLSGITTRWSGTPPYEGQLLISNNLMTNCGDIGAYEGQHSIAVSGCNGGVISNNQIYNTTNITGSSYNYGLYNTGCKNMTITGNQIRAANIGVLLINSSFIDFSVNTMDDIDAVALKLDTVTDSNFSGDEISYADTYGLSMVDCDRNLFSGGSVLFAGSDGVSIVTSDNNTISSMRIDGSGRITASRRGINIVSGINNNIIGNAFSNTNGKTYRGITVANGCTSTKILNNTFRSAGTDANVYNSESTSIIRGNDGYIGTGEIRSYSGTINGTASGTISLSLDNPFGQAIRVLNVQIEITTQSQALGTLNVGVGSSASGNYTNIFSALPCDVGASPPYFYGSTSTVTYGVQTNPVNWATGSGNRYLNFYTLVNTTNLVVTYTVTVMGN